MRDKANTYYQALTVNFCKNFDPKTLPDYWDWVGGGGNNSNNTNNTDTPSKGNTTQSDSSDVNAGAIAAGIIVPIVVIAGAIGGYCYYKKWKSRK